MGHYLFTNFQLLDVEAGRLRNNLQVVVKDGLIAEVAPAVSEHPGRTHVNLGGRTLMPGLIDCHAHIISTRVRRGTKASLGMLPSLVAAHAAQIMRGMLFRGFTTVRDAGGADVGYRHAVEEGHFVGPRLFVSGHGISQTGGHGDIRSPADLGEPCGCAAVFGEHSRIADGITQVRRAVRDEIRMGADQIKVLASGGVGTASDPLHFLQYSMGELAAIVDEADRAGKYVMAHAYTAAAIHRSVEVGIRSIEHGNFIDDRTAALMAEKQAFLVPTLVTYKTLVEHGRTFSFQEENLKKAQTVFEAGAESLKIAKSAGVKMAYGTDLLGELHPYQSDEFIIRSEILSAADILRSATTVAAELLRMDGKLGVIAPGAFADFLVVDGNPLNDLSCLLDQGKQLWAIMKGGEFVKAPGQLNG